MVHDGELVARATKGDVEAFGVLVDRYKERAYMIALGFVGNPDDAMDLSQEAFVKAFRAIKTFREGKPFYPWFYAILRNVCFSHLRRVRTRREQSLDAAQEFGFEVADEAPDPAASTEKAEMIGLVRRELAELEPVHREILLLRHFENLSYKEISEVLGCPMGTVMSRLYAARKALGKRLAPHVGAPDRRTVAARASRAGDRDADGGRR